LIFCDQTIFATPFFSDCIICFSTHLISACFVVDAFISVLIRVFQSVFNSFTLHSFLYWCSLVLYSVVLLLLIPLFWATACVSHYLLLQNNLIIYSCLQKWILTQAMYSKIESFVTSQFFQHLSSAVVVFAFECIWFQFVLYETLWFLYWLMSSTLYSIPLLCIIFLLWFSLVLYSFVLLLFFVPSFYFEWSCNWILIFFAPAGRKNTNQTPLLCATEHFLRVLL
jgi:hypothetical protein